ncbi:MAG: glycoside hydrolase family 3 protein, partial [Veillonella sp.]|nr:glycoside hydrolase family 3 protein [Veillonella sp.]
MKAYVKGLLGLVAVAAIGLGSYWGYHKWQASKVPVSYETVAKTAQTPEEKADALLKDMSDADKVGQLVMFGVHGKDVTEDSRYMINAFKPAGIILFDRNMESKDQVKTLISHLNQVAKDNGNVPMFMAIDQEGGAVTRMSDQLIQAPPAEVLGTESVATAVDWAHKSGQELKDLGFNLNFAPDADLGLSYGRSFSKNP